MWPFTESAAERAAKRASYERKVNRMRGPSAGPRRSGSSAPAPYTCGMACGHPDFATCPSTVRGGVCPCRYC